MEWDVDCMTNLILQDFVVSLVGVGIQSIFPTGTVHGLVYPSDIYNRTISDWNSESQ